VKHWVDVDKVLERVDELLGVRKPWPTEPIPAEEPEPDQELPAA
jgi:hypothetical protein